MFNLGLLNAVSLIHLKQSYSKRENMKHLDLQPKKLLLRYTAVEKLNEPERSRQGLLGRPYLYKDRIKCFRVLCTSPVKSFYRFVVFGVAL